MLFQRVIENSALKPNEFYLIGADYASGRDRTVEVVYEKQCECRLGSSGPRVVLGAEGRTLDLVRMACDSCDRPWVCVGKTS